MSYLTQFYFYSSLAYNVALQKVLRFQWYNRVDDVVILGALPFKSMTKELVDIGVKGVVTMNEPHETEMFVNSPEEWKKAGIEQLVLSTPDWNSVPSNENIRKGVDFILKYRDLKPPNSVYVHCKAGRSRSATIVACYLVKTMQCTPEEAVKLMASARPRIRLMSRHMKAIEHYYQENVK